MAKFSFRLDPVLDHRQRLEDEQQVVLAAAVAKQLTAEIQRDDYIARRADMRARLHEHHNQMDSIELRATYAHCDFLDRSIVAQQRVVDECRAKAEQERAVLILKTKDKKILSTLKDRRRETFESEAAATDQRENDEINSRYFDRVTTLGEIPS
jgi:flagellar export protein FliJ